MHCFHERLGRYASAETQPHLAIRRSWWRAVKGVQPQVCTFRTSQMISVDLWKARALIGPYEATDIGCSPLSRVLATTDCGGVYFPRQQEFPRSKRQWHFKSPNKFTSSDIQSLIPIPCSCRTRCTASCHCHGGILYLNQSQFMNS